MRGATFAAACALALGACGEAALRTPEIVFDTLPGGVVHVRNPETGLWREHERWRLVDDLRIGALEGTGPDVFGQVRALDVDESGRIYVLDSQAHAARVFGPDGRYLRTIGREGAGPGEFRGANGLRIDPAGRLWVADPANARYSVFDTSGALLAAHPRPLRSWGFVWDGEFDGNRLIESDQLARAGRSSVPVLIRFDDAMQPVDTLPAPSYEPPTYVLTDDRGLPRTMATVPFTPSLHRVLGPEGHLWVGVGDRYRIHLQRLDGDTVRIVERPHRPVPVTAAERDEALAAEFYQRMRDQGARIDPALVPAAKPAFVGLATDEAGRLWVRLPLAAGEAGTRFDVFDPDGRYLGQVGTPVELSLFPRLRIVRGSIYGVTRDELDVQYLVRLRIEGSP